MHHAARFGTPACSFAMLQVDACSRSTNETCALCSNAPYGSPSPCRRRAARLSAHAGAEQAQLQVGKGPPAFQRCAHWLLHAACHPIKLHDHSAAALLTARLRFANLHMHLFLQQAARAAQDGARDRGPGAAGGTAKTSQLHWIVDELLAEHISRPRTRSCRHEVQCTLARSAVHAPCLPATTWHSAFVCSTAST